MYYKKCPYCRKKSFSSFTEKWVCPHCHRDISHIPWDIAPPLKEDETAAAKHNKKQT